MLGLLFIPLLIRTVPLSFKNLLVTIRFSLLILSYLICVPICQFTIFFIFIFSIYYFLTCIPIKNVLLNSEDPTIKIFFLFTIKCNKISIILFSFGDLQMIDLVTTLDLSISKQYLFLFISLMSLKRIW